MSPFRKIHGSDHSTAGFSLLEILIVMAILVAALTLIGPNVTNRNNKMKAAVRRFSVLTKEVRTHAKLYGTSYRIAFDLGEREDDPQTYWIEKANYAVLIPGDKAEFIEEQNTAARAREVNKGKSPDTSGFSEDSSIMKGKQELPGGLRFQEIELEGHDDSIDSGRVYVHFHPQGLVEEAAIHLQYGEDSDALKWTIAIHPLTGRADIITDDVSLKEIKEQ
ncbi:MAG: prepilin-type N-terminal cleavage/methylation domain-containing protein [Bdellovibrionales bacterium]|nr:prepilin-type N-terminal cleavage/methylation domain-containing protein [Bdellovibrionales bacterium]